MPRVATCIADFIIVVGCVRSFSVIDSTLGISISRSVSVECCNSCGFWSSLFVICSDAYVHFLEDVYEIGVF